MGMTPPTPHLVSSTRVTRSDGETFTTPAAVLTAEPAFIVPYEPGDTQQSVMGPMDVSRFIMFIGYTADVKYGDTIVKDSTGETFEVVEPPVKIERPPDFQPDHQQVRLVHSPLT